MNRAPNVSRLTLRSWGRYALGCFGFAAALLTAASATFVFDRIDVVFALGALVIALALFGVGLHARRKAHD